MNLRILSSCVLIFSFITLYAQKKEERIVWSKERKLTWEDFKGKPKSNREFVAVSQVGIKTEFQYKDGTIIIKIESVFHPKNSWVKKTDREKLLQHENIHFDIVEWHARRLRKELLATKFKKNGEKAKKEYSKILNRVRSEKNAHQDLYDQETNFSIDEEKQKEWRVKVAKELEELEAYSNPEIIIDLTKKKKRKK